MTTLLSPLPVQRFYDNNNVPLVGGLLYTYIAGTSTPCPTYTDSTGVTANTNPIVLNSRGEANVWLTSGQAYKFVLQDSTFNTIWTTDQINAPTGSGSNDNLLINANFSILQRAYTSGTATTGANQYTLDRWRVPINGQSITFAAGTPDRVVTCPAGGLEQPIEAGMIAGGIYTLSWIGTATATVNGTAIANGGNTASLAANTQVVVNFANGTVSDAVFNIGTSPLSYPRRAIGLELLLCQRYYQVLEGGVTSPVSAGNIYGSVIQFFTQMRTTPTISVGNDLIATNFGGATSATPNSAYSFYCVKAASVTGNGQYITRFTASAEL